MRANYFSLRPVSMLASSRPFIATTIIITLIVLSDATAVRNSSAAIAITSSTQAIAVCARRDVWYRGRASDGNRSVSIRCRKSGRAVMRPRKTIETRRGRKDGLSRRRGAAAPVPLSGGGRVTRGMAVW